MDKIYGLDLGSDDYLVKPFSVMEMISRVKAVLRRCNKSNNQEEKTIQDGCLVLNKEEHSVFINQEKSILQSKSFHFWKFFYQQRVFERFFRVDKSHSRETGGTGLGLSIVKHAAKIQNAKLTLESQENHGTWVSVVF